MRHQGSRGAAYGEAYRDNDRASVQDPALAALLWRATGLEDLFRRGGGEHPYAGSGGDDDGGGGWGWEAAGLNPNLRFYR